MYRDNTTDLLSVKYALSINIYSWLVLPHTLFSPQILSIVYIIAYIFEKHGWVEFLGTEEAKISLVYESLDYSTISSMFLINQVTFRRKKKTWKIPIQSFEELH